MKIVTVEHIQPFESRVGEDTVIALRFPYSAELVEAIKDIIRKHKGEYPQGKAFQAGGWLPDLRCWFIEAPLWPDVASVLTEQSYEASWVR